MVEPISPYAAGYLYSLNLLRDSFGSQQAQFGTITNVDQYVKEAGELESFLASQKGSPDQPLYDALMQGNPLYPLYDSQGLVYGINQPTLAAGTIAEQQSLAGRGVLPDSTWFAPVQEPQVNALEVNQPTLAAQAYLEAQSLGGSDAALPVYNPLGLLNSLPPPGTGLDVFV